MKDFHAKQNPPEFLVQVVSRVSLWQDPGYPIPAMITDTVYLVHHTGIQTVGSASTNNAFQQQVFCKT